MKKSLFFIAVAALSLCSCSTISHTSTTQDVNTALLNRTSANLKVSDQVIKYTFVPNDTYRRAGLKSMKNAAVTKALEENGYGDVLVCPQFEIKKTRGFFRSRVKYITVKGHPAKYENFHSTTQQDANIINTLNGGCNK